MNYQCQITQRREKCARLCVHHKACLLTLGITVLIVKYQQLKLNTKHIFVYGLLSWSTLHAICIDRTKCVGVIGLYFQTAIIFIERC